MKNGYCTRCNASCQHEKISVKNGEYYWHIDPRDMRQCYRLEKCKKCGEEFFGSSTNHRGKEPFSCCGLVGYASQPCFHLWMDSVDKSPEMSYWTDEETCREIRLCSKCKATLLEAPTPHTWEYDDKGKATCTRCKHISGVKCYQERLHQWKLIISPLDQDQCEFKKICTCGHVLWEDRQAHKFSLGHPRICQHCQYEPACSHQFIDGQCVVCGKPCDHVWSAYSVQCSTCNLLKIHDTVTKHKKEIINQFSDMIDNIKTQYISLTSKNTV